MLELSTATGATLLHDSPAASPLLLAGVSISAPLVLQPQGRMLLQCQVQCASGSVIVRSVVGKADAWQVHCKGSLSIMPHELPGEI